MSLKHIWHGICKTRGKQTKGKMNKENIKEEEILDKESVNESENTENQANDTATETPAEETVEKTVEEKLADAEAKVAELETKILYKQAEFENFRKRNIQEKADLILNGGSKVLAAILPIVDDMERALANIDKAEDLEAVKKGEELIYQKLMNILKGQGVTPIDTKEADFNTDLHEAVAQFPAPCDEMKGKVIDCTEKGYKLNEKVLRFAKVVVGV